MRWISIKSLAGLVASTQRRFHVFFGFEARIITGPSSVGNIDLYGIRWGVFYLAGEGLHCGMLICLHNWLAPRPAALRAIYTYILHGRLA
jgi:hypothetical protein